MADIITSIAALTPVTVAETTSVLLAGGDLTGLITEAQQQAGQLLRAVNLLAASLPSGDSNLSTINALSVAILSVGTLNFSTAAQSGHIATTSFNFA